MTRLLIVGCGSIGSRHAKNAAGMSAGEIGLVDPDQERRNRLAVETGARAFESLDAALSWGPEVAVICTPPPQHTAAALACANAGCHLLIEKPLAASLDGLDELEAAIGRRQVGAAVAYQLRFHPAVARLRELVCSGTIGRLLVIRAEFGLYLPDWRPSRDHRETYTAHLAEGGGILLDASHEIDYVRWIAGEVTGVYAATGQLSGLTVDVEDTAALILRMDRGVIGEVHLDCVQRGYARGCTLIGTEATVHWTSASGLKITASDGSVRDEPLVPAANDPYLAELQRFLSARSAVAPFASVADARRVLSIALAARRSAAEHREIGL